MGDAFGNIDVAGYSIADWGDPTRMFTDSASDCWIAKLASNGDLVWSTFLGGDGFDSCQDIAIDTSGNLIVAGNSTATWGEPVRAHSSQSDGFVVKLAPSGEVVWLTFLGGAGIDGSARICATPDGGMVVVGVSDASWLSPVRLFGSDRDSFAVKLSSDGVLSWNTFLGGPGTDEWTSCAIDSQGNIGLAGSSDASWGDPLRSFTNADDAFVAKLAPDGSLAWNTFLGGDSLDFGSSVAFTDTDLIVVAGSSTGSWGTPIRMHSSSYDAFVATLSSGGALQWHTFVGGDAADNASSVIAKDGRILIAGRSGAAWGTPSTAFLGAFDGYVAHLRDNGLLEATAFVGGTGSDTIHALALSTDGDSLLAAGTSSSSWGMPRRAFSSPWDAFVALLPFDLVAPLPSVAPTSTATPVPPPTPMPPRVRLGPISPVAGSSVSLPVSIDVGGFSASAVNIDLTFDPLNTPIVGLYTGAPSCVANPALLDVAGAFLFRPPDCVGPSCNNLFGAVFPTFPVRAIPDGSVLFSCEISVRPEAAPGLYPLNINALVVADLLGSPISNPIGIDGFIEVQPNAQVTPTSTPAVSPVEVCCQCGSFACGPSLAGGNCGVCDTVENASCNAEQGRCVTSTPILTRTPTPIPTSTATQTDTETRTPPPEATQTRTPSPTPTIACTCPGDASRNGFVNFADYGSVAENFGRPPYPLTGVGDANCNGFVNFADYGAVTAYFGKMCTP